MLQELLFAKLDVKQVLTIYFLSYCLKSATMKLSLCSQYIIRLTLVRLSHIVAQGGKKWVKVGAHPEGRRRKGEEGREAPEAR